MILMERIVIDRLTKRSRTPPGQTTKSCATCGWPVDGDGAPRHGQRERGAGKEAPPHPSSRLKGPHASNSETDETQSAHTRSDLRVKSVQRRTGRDGLRGQKGAAGRSNRSQNETKS